MPTYGHKKSSRTITKEQFSDGTTIDGDRLDNALEDVEQRLNNIRKGDIRTRFTQQQYVFGYSPHAFPENTYTATTPGYKAIDTYIRSPTRFPWTFIVNNQHTTLDPQPRAPDPIPDNYEYPPENYNNRNRYKGTHIDSAHLGLEEESVGSSVLFPDTRGAQQPLNDKTWANSEWRQSFVGEIVAYTGVTPAVNYQYWPRVDNHYQMAWSHSWEFTTPTILDDLMLLFRIDEDYYKATFKDGSNNPVDQAVVQLSVDSPLAPHKREYNSIVVMRHQIDFSKNLVMPADPAFGDRVGTPSRDMMPVMNNNDSVADNNRPINGRMEHLRNLDIPLPANSKLRLAIILPAFAARSAASSPDYEHSHWPEVNGSSALLANYKDQYGWSANRWESMMDWSLNGCLTVLSEIKK